MKNTLHLIPFGIVNVMAVLLAACGGKDSTTATKKTDPKVSESSASKAVAVSVVAASPAECAQGGTVFFSFQDLNENGLFDKNEKKLSTAKVCNGQDGSNGAGAGILVEAASGISCPSGGSVFSTYVDNNNNGVLDGAETLQSQSTLCNGVNGAQGLSASLSATTASAGQCSAGGAVYTSSVEGQSPQVVVVCNGTNGQNGASAQFQMGALGPEINEGLSACHHDYLYLPDENGSSRGWLTFRHQSNGSRDQGIGSTGFQIWNVDIADFNLVSEVGGVTYCRMHWDPFSKILSYEVVDNTNGMQGKRGEYRFE